MRLLRVCVIGAGKMGADHVERLSHRIAGAEVTVVVDADIARAGEAVKSTPAGVPISGIKEALGRTDVDAVLIATPGFLHKDMVLEAMELGLPILCEKPLTPDAASAWEIVETEQRSGMKRVQVG